ncbi:hypothetical protein Q5Y75_02755 [Ruegeria sp. 2205SS24-7]|uniref:hypothetical protein n=1 Tax=Ruegeria discodermiae TaxID=3064389 RepID=UPI002740997A|nr:hypothetical protein [Ruegeria sp. 2205SS24-7]MDP5216127.1 hypothetical protein [Ruegeria sp. 2205SS24-7]
MTDMHQKGSDKLAAIYERAWSDKAFSTRLESNTRAAIEEVVGELPQDMELKVVRDTAGTKYLHIPAAPKQGEISDQDLMEAQGGTSPICASVWMTITLASVIPPTTV